MSRTILSDKFKRTATGRFEVFQPVVTLTPRQRETFLRDQSKYLRKLFEKRGHLVNNFYVSAAAERKAIKILDTIPKDKDAQFIEIIVHVVSGGGMASTYV
jgi:hypothetical protein